MESHEIMVSVGFCVVTAIFIFQFIHQQRTIDRLTDRLMARSYTEYKKADSGIKEDDISPVQEDDPKGWFDH